MSYNLMVFNQRKVPCEFGQLRPWFHTHMEEDVLPEKNAGCLLFLFGKGPKAVSAHGSVSGKPVSRRLRL